ncbi:WecB/TagA/CpsF family glycosyltransferase [Luteococcus peritonei]
MAGVPFWATTLDQAAEDTVTSFTGRGPVDGGVPIRLMNSYCVALASTDPAYMRLVNDSGINYPDGRWVAWVMQRTSKEPSGQVRGPSYFVRTLELGVPHGTRHYFFGTTDETLRLMDERLTARFPGLVIAGTSAAPFAPVEEILTDEVVDQIRATNPDIVWVGLGTPKQDWVAQGLAERLGLPVAAVGAAFDFAAGSTPEAPQIFQRLGMEWLFRLVTEPRRLWKRYLWGNSRYLQQVVPQLLRRGVDQRR